MEVKTILETTEVEKSDHLGNRREASVGEFIIICIFVERLSNTFEIEPKQAQDSNAKPITTSFKDFSIHMDQIHSSFMESENSVAN